MGRCGQVVQIFAIGSFGAFLSGCAMDVGINRDAEIDLAPMPRPAMSERVTERHFLDKGFPVTTRILERDETSLTRTVTAGYPKGCTWTDDGWFAPSFQWEDCGGTSGTSEYSTTGNIWPLQVGASESYEITGRSERSSWEGTRRCEVTGTALITLNGNEFPTYEVVCKDPGLIQTWYISPDVGEAIRFKKVHRQRGVLEDIEAVL